jgi:hypothetical protein
MRDTTKTEIQQERESALNVTTDDGVLDNHGTDDEEQKDYEEILQNEGEYDHKDKVHTEAHLFDDLDESQENEILAE